MATIEHRLDALERSNNNAPWLIMCVDSRPTTEQQAEIDKAKRTGRRLIVFYMPGDTAWILGCGKPAPWEFEEGEYGND